MIPIQIKIYLLIGILIIVGGFIANYKYQQFTIESLENKLKMATEKATALETNINSISKTIDTFKVNQVETRKETDKLKKSITRLDTVKAKPGLISIKIEKSYKQFHLEKACYSGNKEACNAITK